MSLPRDARGRDPSIAAARLAVRATLAGVTPSEFAAVELALWEQALQEQRAAEQQLERARSKAPRSRLIALESQVAALRIRADLLLAEAAKAQCAFRDGADPDADPLTSTRMGLLDDDGS